MTLLLNWIATTPLADTLKASALFYMIVNATHILGIGLLLGAILPLDLRLLGVFRAAPLAIVGPFLSRCAALGLSLAIVTGAMLFTVRPLEYAGNPAFLAKLCLLLFGLANVLACHGGGAWRQSLEQGEARGWARLFAALSSLTWLSALLAGRWIGFL